MSKTIANFDGYAIDMVNGQPCFIEDGDAQPINADHYFCVDPHDYAHLKRMATLDLPAGEISAIEAVIEGVYESNPSINPERHAAEMAHARDIAETDRGGCGLRSSQLGRQSL